MKTLFILPLIAFLLVSCASNTPAKRIEENPGILATLNASQKALIAEGKIENGMSTEAVYLAWGKPDAKTKGQEQKHEVEKWTYTGLAPIYRQSLYGGSGFVGRTGGFGRSSGFGRGGFGGGGFGSGRGFSPYNSFGTEVSYIPYRSAWVKFKKGRVTSWERG